MRLEAFCRFAMRYLDASWHRPYDQIGDEGEIDEERENWWLDTYVCVNEQAQRSPALGAEPPARFRQHGTPEAGL